MKGKRDEYGYVGLGGNLRVKLKEREGELLIKWIAYITTTFS